MVTRITGTSSGLDVDSLVSKLMKAERVPMDKLNQKKQILNWQRDSYKEINSKLLDFRNNKLLNFKLDATLKASIATLTGNPTAISAKANSNASVGSLTVQVTNLAIAARNIGTTDIRTNATFDPTLTLGSQAAKITNSFTQTVPGTYDNQTISINGTSVVINPNVDSMNDVIDRINRNTNVNAFFDTASGKVSFVSKQTGVTNGATKDQANIVFQDTTGTFMATTFNISSGTAGAGVNASVTINGINTTRTSNTFNVNGVDITLLQEGGSSTTINVSSDVDKIVSSIKNFIKDYNDMLDTLNSKVSEEKYRDFLPLTDDQKKSMSETDIKAWEDKAKSGLLKNDSVLSKAISNMRVDIVSIVTTGDASYNMLGAIGIKTGTYTDKGKLYLSNESKLRTALANNPDAVAAIFSAPGTGLPDRSDMGVVQRIYDDLKTTLTDISKKAGTSSFADTTILDGNSFIGKDLTYINTQILNENRRLTDAESRYYKQFTAMETAMSRYNSQSASLTNLLNRGQNQ